MEHPIQHLERRLRELEHSHRRLHQMLRNGGGGQAGAADDDKDGAIYGVTVPSLLTTVTTTQALQIDALSAFELEMIVGYAEAVGGAFPQAKNLAPQLTLQIADGRENRTLFDQAYPWGMVVGQADLPFMFGRNRIFSPNQSISITIKNFSAVTYNNIFVGLVGTRIYPEGQQR